MINLNDLTDNKYVRLFNTVKHLKLKQIYFRFLYIIKNKIFKLVNYSCPPLTKCNNKELHLQNTIRPIESYIKNNTFLFLNKIVVFENEVDWNYSDNGKLWTYNLNYFDFLMSNNCSVHESLNFINHFIEKSSLIKDGMEAFPLSIRCLNWVKFLTYNNINNSKVNASLYAQYSRLMNNFEYHLLGNHVLENAFSLLFGAYYFDEEKFYIKAEKLLFNELEEQILDDGAHFELSPMYHKLMLFRLLDSINLLQNNQNQKHKYFLDYLKKKASVMLGWLENITYKNGKIPLFNDSTNNIAPTSIELFDYAKTLNLKIKKLNLKESGYRKISNLNYEMIVDIGNIGPDYILGHAHADTFNFELYVKEVPIIVDTGLSTYEIGKRRDIERSTSAHNTVCINDINQSDVWGGFRVGKRAKIIKLFEDKDSICATHNGYAHLDIYHTRKFRYGDKEIQIFDKIDSKLENNYVAYIHFHPDVNFEQKDFLIILSKLNIEFIGCKNVIVEDYLYADEFNKTHAAKCLAVYFDMTLETRILINN